MSHLIRSELFDWLIESVKLSDNSSSNLGLTSALATLLYVITFNMVRKLYQADMIDGRLSGKICYFILFLVNTLITALILRVIRRVIWLCNYLLACPLWIWIIVIGGIFFIGIIILSFVLRGNIHKKQKISMKNKF